MWCFQFLVASVCFVADVLHMCAWVLNAFILVYSLHERACSSRRCRSVYASLHTSNSRGRSRRWSWEKRKKKTFMCFTRTVCYTFCVDFFTDIWIDVDALLLSFNYTQTHTHTKHFEYIYLYSVYFFYILSVFVFYGCFFFSLRVLYVCMKWIRSLCVVVAVAAAETLVFVLYFCTNNEPHIRYIRTHTLSAKLQNDKQ